MPFADQAEAKNVKILSASWNSTWMDEMTAIPNSTFRDQGDVTAGAFNKLTLKKESAKMVGTSGLYRSRRGR